MANDIQYKQYSELDFQNIKDSLKTHLKSQDILKDFDFEGSNINVIMNLLAYNTQYNSYYLNMMASEKFIATAQKRESIVGAANNIGYIPYSKKSSTAYLSFTITPDVGYVDSITIPKNVKFEASIDGTSYSFLTTQNSVVVPVNGIYSVVNLEVKEGKLFNHKFTIGATDKFLKIPNTGLDYNRLVVNVKQSISDVNNIEYSKYTNITNLTSLSTVYFIQEASGGLYEIYFGDGILGKALSVGNVVSVEYYVTEGSVPNGVKEFSLADEVTGLSSITFTNVISASSGSMEESINSIRISAPANFQTQNRAITELDFEVLVKQIYPNAKQVSAIGGERYTPVQFGKIFISILKNDLNILSNKDKADIVLALRNSYSGLTVFPVISDPYIIRLVIDTTLHHTNDGISETEIKTAAYNTIREYADIDINTFKFTLRKSRFESLIDNSHNSILSNTTNFKLYINTNDTIIASGDNFIKFAQQISEKSLTSSVFAYKSIQNCQLLDIDGLGFGSIYSKDVFGVYTLVKSDVVSINYLTGYITYIDSTYSLAKLSIDNSSGIKLYVTPASDDIKVTDNYVLFVNDDDITIKATLDV